MRGSRRAGGGAGRGRAGCAAASSGTGPRALSSGCAAAAGSSGASTSSGASAPLFWRARSALSSACCSRLTNRPRAPAADSGSS
ncbi:hypothetical protein C7C56_014245 [Massilia glaciei]|uniref:Uncharacterized protein n=1 Tax=Massilia glaciei TaxID=1524097 RepID=A0A2U2HJR8_9BURK|nr:hypothetical protein C7C56_014245 [Massilia glaciei]